MSAEPVPAEPQDLPSPLDAILDEAVALCKDDGLTAMEAAKACASVRRLPASYLYGLAVIGLARIVQDRIGRPKTKLRKEERASPAARRQVLYERTRDALTSLLQAADGTMRALYDFSTDDHRARLGECEAHSTGWRKAARFHHESVTELKRCGASTIRELPADVQERLRRLL